jgi:hypothetical protein
MNPIFQYTNLVIACINLWVATNSLKIDSNLWVTFLPLSLLHFGLVIIGNKQNKTPN